MIAWSSTSTIRVGIGRGRCPVGAAPALPCPVAVTAVVLIARHPRPGAVCRAALVAHGVGMSTCTCSPPSRARRKVSVPPSSRARAAMFTSPRCSPDGQATLAARRLRRTSSGRPEPSSEIVSRTAPAAVGQPHDGPARVGVHGGVEQRLARDPEERLLAVRGQRHRLAADPHLDPQLVRHVHAREPPEHRRQVLVRLALAVVQRVDRRPQLLDGAAREVLGGVEVGAQPGDPRPPCAPARCACPRRARTG